MPDGWRVYGSHGVVVVLAVEQYERLKTLERA